MKPYHKKSMLQRTDKRGKQRCDYIFQMSFSFLVNYLKTQVHVISLTCDMRQ